jgi:hypothetical protein
MLRKIQLKNFGPIFGGEQVFTTVVGIDMIVTAPLLVNDRAQPLSLPMMRQIGKILDALDTVKNSGADVLLLDETQWAFLKSRAENPPWVIYRRELLELTEDILNAPAFDPNAPQVVEK